MSNQLILKPSSYSISRFKNLTNNNNNIEKKVTKKIDQNYIYFYNWVNNYIYLNNINKEKEKIIKKKELQQYFKEYENELNEIKEHKRIMKMNNEEYIEEFGTDEEKLEFEEYKNYCKINNLSYN